jgi:septum formation protein
LVISADTVVLTLPPGLGDTSATGHAPIPVGWRPDILEKPLNKEDQLRMLADLNGESCEVVTGIAIVYPVLQSPGYQIVYV